MNDRSNQLIFRALREPQILFTLGPGEWSMLLRQAKVNRLQGRLAALVGGRDFLSDLPEPVKPHLEAASILAERHERSALWEVKRVSQALKGVDTPIVVLKGAAYALLGLDTGRGRLFGDLDILVCEEALDPCEASLKAHGWEVDEESPFDEAYFRRWMHELPPLKHRLRNTVLDVHHSIIPRTLRTRLDPRLLIDASIPAMGERVRVLNPVDMVLHSATHIFIYSDFHNALRDLADLDSLLRQFCVDPGFWDRLVSRAHELDLKKPCFLGMRYANRYFGTPIPREVNEATAEWQPGSLSVKILDRLVNCAIDPGPEYDGKRSRDLAVSLMSNWPLPSMRAVVTPLFWLKRLPFRMRQDKKKEEP